TLRSHAQRRYDEPHAGGRSSQPQSALGLSTAAGRSRCRAFSHGARRTLASGDHARGGDAVGLSTAPHARRGVVGINDLQLPIRAAWRGRGILLPRQGPLPKEFASMKLPRNFFKPLAVGAPAPLRELPVRLERMIHFVPPHIEKLRAKVPE